MPSMSVQVAPQVQPAAALVVLAVLHGLATRQRGLQTLTLRVAAAGLETEQAALAVLAVLAA